MHKDDREQVTLHVSALLTAGLIQKWKRTAFVSYPFVVPKASGESRLIVDFSHLRGKYTKPVLHMPAFPAVLQRLYPLEQGDYLVRIDLRAAFYNVPLPERLRDVTAFRFDCNTYVFKVLPLGLFISPAILQAVVQEAVRKIVPGPQRRDGTFAWVHLDDILVAANTWQKIQTVLRKLVRVLHEYGFYLAPKKSILKPTQTLSYCGLLLDTRQARYAVSTSRIHFFQQLLRTSARFSKQAWGYLAFWLYALGLSSIARLLNYNKHHALLRILESGPWPLPRPPERIWATDASDLAVAVVAPTQLIYKGDAFGNHIFENELLALFVAAFFAPNNTAILCDNTAVIGATSHRSSRPPLLAIATAVLRAKKNLCFWYIPSCLNPADHPSRCIEGPCSQQVCGSKPAVSVHLERDWLAMTKREIQ